MAFNWRTISFFLGVFLLGLTIFGRFQTLRNPVIYQETRGTTQKNELVFPPDKVLQVLEQPVMDRHLWLHQLNEVVNKGIAHYWEDEGLNNYNLRIPWSENFILASLGLAIPDWFGKWEIFDYRKAVERGVGLCSQQSIIILQVLADKGIPAKMLGLSNHRIITAEVEPGQWWILDPDFGVVIESDLATVELDSNIVRDAYREAGHSKKDVDNMVRMFELKGKRVEPLSVFYKERYYLEPLTYILIWLIPLGLLLPKLLHKRSHSE